MNEAINNLKSFIKSSPYYRRYYGLKSRSNLLRGGSYCFNIELTTHCNSRCSFCPHSSIIESPENMNLEKFKLIIDKINDFTGGISHQIIPVGLGDPLLYPDLIPAMQYMKEKIPFWPIQIVTNGIGLNSSLAKGLIDNLDYNDSVLISLNFNDRESYERSTGVDKYYQVVDNIMYILDLDVITRPAVKVQFMGHNGSRLVFNNFYDKWTNKLDKDNKDFVFLRELEAISDLSPDIVSSKIFGNKARYPCMSLWSSVSILIDGSVYPCCLPSFSRKCDGLLLGNIFTDSFSFINIKRERLKNKHLRSQWDLIDECSKCEMWRASLNCHIKVGNTFR